MSPVILGNIDVALLTFYAFVLFFIGLVIHLRRENRREGFPLEDEGGRALSTGALLDPSPKTFRLPFGRGVALAPTYRPEPVDLPATRDRFPGAPLRPTGNPLASGMGPAAYALRADVPDLDMEGHPRIVPLSATENYWLDRRDRDPRGLKVIAADGAVAGTVTDVWVDRADRLIRYLSVDTGTRTVLAPMTMARVKRGAVVLDAITAAQYADAPAIKSPTTITFLEEEMIQAYFGGGYLYAMPQREEPLI
jgi:photosynthetic reaction center H subunit